MLKMFTKCFLLLLYCLVANAGRGMLGGSMTRRCFYPRLENGTMRIVHHGRTEVAVYHCESKYELVGSQYAMCLHGILWIRSKPICVKPGCPSFTVENGVSTKNHHDAWVTTYCLPGYQRVGSADIYCNGHQWNGPIPECVSSSVAERLSCDFEAADLCGWKQDELHDFDWSRINMKSPNWFLNSGPKFDHTYGKGGSGYYMYLASSSKQTNDSARLMSPVYEKNLTSDGCFSFYYHMFGRDVGALRVYQKPDRVQMSELLNSTRYTLFEQSGNLGDFWYSAAVQLKDFGDNFQIVIEGLLGKIYTSGIAVDDVAILQGVNCTYFRNAGTTPVPPANALTCAGRCDNLLPVPHGCECKTSCVLQSTCCADYLDICVFANTETSKSEYVETQTEELVGGNTTTAMTTTSTSPSTTTTTTAEPHTTPSTKQSTITTKLTTSTTKLTTLKATTKVIVTTKVMPKSTVVTTMTTAVVAMTTLIPTNGTVTKEEKQDKEAGVQKMSSDKIAEKSSKSRSWMTAVISIVCLAILAAVVFLGLTFRRNGGKITLTRRRERVLETNDPEVRYLNLNNDDL